jgi:hypothetical protein
MQPNKHPPTPSTAQSDRPRRPPASLSEAVKKVSKLLADSPTRVFQSKDLERLIVSKRVDLAIPRRVSTREFLKVLLESTPLRQLLLAPVPPADYDAPVRFVWGQVSPFSVALSLRAGSYLSHGSAVFLHGLTEQIPKTIYVNKEQSPKPAPSSPPSQETIDRAFQNEPRVSKYQFEFEGYRTTLLSGKNTGRLEVTRLIDEGAPLDVTKVERTLIDIAVRPVYAGGVFEVLKAYRAARERTAVNTLVATLKRLQYAYPYHQAIGFYMERAGFAPAQLDKLRSLGLPFRFYLTNRMNNPRFSKDWQLFIPEGI